MASQIDPILLGYEARYADWMNTYVHYIMIIVSFLLLSPPPINSTYYYYRYDSNFDIAFDIRSLLTALSVNANMKAVDSLVKMNAVNNQIPINNAIYLVDTYYDAR